MCNQTPALLLCKIYLTGKRYSLFSWEIHEWSYDQAGVANRLNKKMTKHRNPQPHLWKQRRNYIISHWTKPLQR